MLKLLEDVLSSPDLHKSLITVSAFSHASIAFLLDFSLDFSVSWEDDSTLEVATIEFVVSITASVTVSVGSTEMDISNNIFVISVIIAHPPIRPRAVCSGWLCSKSDDTPCNISIASELNIFIYE